jgi:hypothetical protein
MSVCPTLRRASPDGGRDSSGSPPRVALHPDFAPVRGLEILGDHLEGVINSPYRKRA